MVAIEQHSLAPTLHPHSVPYLLLLSLLSPPPLQQTHIPEAPFLRAFHAIAESNNIDLLSPYRFHSNHYLRLTNIVFGHELIFASAFLGLSENNYRGAFG